MDEAVVQHGTIGSTRACPASQHMRDTTITKTSHWFVNLIHQQVLAGCSQWPWKTGISMFMNTNVKSEAEPEKKNVSVNDHSRIP